MPLGLELAAQLGVVLDDPVEDDLDAVLAVAVRVGVLLGHPAVGRPAGVGEPDRRRRRRTATAEPPSPSSVEADRGAQVGEVADRPHRVDLAVARAARCRRSRSRGTRASPARPSADRGRGACPRIRRFRTWEATRVERPRRRAMRRRPPALDLGELRLDDLTRRAQTSSHSSSVGASTITRTSGSVPEARTRTRPRPSSAPLSRSTASQTAVARSSAPRSAISTFSSICGSCSIGIACGEVAAAERPHHEQRRGDPVAGRPELAPDDVAGLLAAERPAAPLELRDHVAVADRRGRHLDPRLCHRPVKAVVAHHGHGDAAVERARVRADAGRRARSARRRREPRPLASTASTRSPSPSKAKPISRRSRGRARPAAPGGWSRSPR